MPKTTKSHAQKGKKRRVGSSAKTNTVGIRKQKKKLKTQKSTPPTKIMLSFQSVQKEAYHELASGLESLVCESERCMPLLDMANLKSPTKFNHEKNGFAVTQTFEKKIIQKKLQQIVVSSIKKVFGAKA